jgi:trehalose 6-phosphate phosphatase
VVAPFRGAFVEQKGLSVAVHHRALSPRRRAALRARLRAVEPEMLAHGFGTQLGDRVNDFVPVGYDKGRAIRALRARVRPGVTIFFGDSAGDEPAFAALAPADVSVCVGSGPTAARYRVRGPRDVARFLSGLVAERMQQPSLRRR